MKYTYPFLSASGYHWNVLNRIKLGLGITPLGIGNTDQYFFVEFENELTTEQKTTLDTIMADNPELPPNTTNTVFKIVDIWEERENLKALMGLDFEMWFSQAVPGSGIVDRIELHFKKQLSVQERNKVINTYQDLISLK